MPDWATLLQIVQSTAALATPLVVLFVGLLINRRLEQSKAAISKERDWQSRWAESFLSRASNFNDAVEDLVILLFQCGELSRLHDETSQSRLNQKSLAVNEARDRLQKAEWSLKIHVNFASRHGGDVMKETEQIFSLVANLLNSKQGPLDPIREALIRFNAAVKRAHRELLALE
jgi:hypothetical protein